MSRMLYQSKATDRPDLYQYSSAQTLHQLYLALVRPRLEYTVSVWSPHLQKDIDMLEKTQKFATKVCTKLWDWSYHELVAKLPLQFVCNQGNHPLVKTGHR